VDVLTDWGGSALSRSRERVARQRRVRDPYRCSCTVSPGCFDVKRRPRRETALYLTCEEGESRDGARTALLRMIGPRVRTRWMSVANKAARFGRDAYSGVVPTGLTIRLAQNRSQARAPGR
jgi:hypothetical protein